MVQPPGLMCKAGQPSHKPYPLRTVLARRQHVEDAKYMDDSVQEQPSLKLRTLAEPHALQNTRQAVLIRA